MVRVEVAALLLGAMMIGTAPAGAQGFTRGDPVRAPMTLGHRSGDPLYDMPAGQRLISAFGERPVFSPDGHKIAFIGKSYGDAYEYDLDTGRIRNLTAHAPHAGWLRVHYLSDGSYLLLGPHQAAASREQTRFGHIELFWMDAEAARPPVPLKVTVFEGIATSRISNRIAWSEFKSAGSPAKPVGTTLKTGTVVVRNGTPAIEQVKDEVTTTECFAEAQDFLPGDKGLTMPCYHFGRGNSGDIADVLSIEFASGRLTRYPTPPGLYSEIEGIFPGGKRSLVECSGDRTAGMELCVLDLVPTGARFTRMTHITDFGRWKYGNPVVSPDGRHVAAQIGPADVADAGVGLGIVLMDLVKNF